MGNGSVIRCQKAHNEPSHGSSKLEMSKASSSCDTSMVLKSVNGSLAKKSASVVHTMKADHQMVRSHEQIAEDTRELSTLVRSTNVQVLERDPLAPTLPKTSPEHLQLGLGIVDFLKDKNLLITGATGFFAKVLIEKILRMQPNVGKLFVIVKAKDYDAALQRIRNEIMYTDLFKCIQENYGHEYESFMLQKLVPVTGNVTRDELGIQPDMADELLQDVDIVLNSAANTTFDERYDVALDINTKGVCRVLEFARRCKKLQLFLQISTAYVNGTRKGRVVEKAFHMGDTIASEKEQLGLQTSPLLDIQAELELANITLDDFMKNNPLDSNGHNAIDVEKHLIQTMKDLGMGRAQLYGWQDTYVFTKAMGEMLIDNGRGDLPVVIIRPSVIESTYSDPFPGWMEGNRMMDPIILYYGKGQLPGFLGDPNGVLDVVPADMVVNATLAAMTKHAGNSGLNVYHVSSSVANPLEFGELAGVVFEHFKSNPYVDTKGRSIRVKKLKLFGEIDDFTSQTWSHVSTEVLNMGSNGSARPSMMSEKYKRICAKSIEQAKYLATIYKPYTFYKGRFDNSNTDHLFQQLCEEEKRNFNFDVSSIKWTDYISETHIPGLRQHVMKGRGTKLEA